ncbi:hypothetical protein Syun_020759 [Stephania yunnanensis]|uniref:Uncharacterized protein n=1 Tax=Stephania yunnanensis TaxID=152371 RepID=A0AAP0NNI8_9MAGN
METKKEMQKFTAKIVDMMKQEKLYASQGGPIILSQASRYARASRKATDGKDFFATLAPNYYDALRPEKRGPKLEANELYTKLRIGTSFYGAVSLLGFSAMFSVILLAQESIYGQMAAYMKESGEGNPPIELLIDSSCVSEIEEGADGVWSIVGGKDCNDSTAFRAANLRGAMPRTYRLTVLMLNTISTKDAFDDAYSVYCPFPRILHTLERICSWALFSSLFGWGSLGRNLVNMHYHWLLSSDGESEVLQSGVIVIIWSPYCSSYSDQSCWSFGDWSC